MKRQLIPTDESIDDSSGDLWENDEVWKLLDQASPVSTKPQFVNDTLRAARLLGRESTPWWKRLFAPIPLAGLAATTAAVIFSIIQISPLLNPRSIISSEESVAQTNNLEIQQATDIEDVAETEALIAAVDQLDDFSDTELVSLIGF